MSVIEITFESFCTYFRKSDEQSLDTLAKEIDAKLYNTRKVAKKTCKAAKKQEVWYELPCQSDAVKTMKTMGLNPTDF